MTGMIEKVARAILHRQLAGFSDQYAEETWYAVAREERENSAAWRLAVVQARAAIEAMREPTEGMLDDADEPFHDEWKRQRESNVKAGRDKNAGFGSGPFSSRIWQAMITAALTKGEG